MATTAMVIAAAMLILGTRGPKAAAITAYDCESGEVRAQAIDLTRTADCLDPETDYQDEEPRQVQVLQVDTDVPVHAWVCKIEMTKKVARCGHDSITYGDNFAAWEQTVPVPAAECLRAAETGVIKIMGRTFEAAAGTKRSVSFYSHGNVDANGNCETEVLFVSEGQIFHWSYEQTLLVIYISKTRGTHDSSDGWVRFQNGRKAKFSEGFMHDAFEGTIVWPTLELPCEAKVSSVYFGNATLRRTKTEALMGAIVMVEAPETKQYAGLEIRRVHSVCAVHCYGTQVKGIVVCLLREGDGKVIQSTFKAHFNPEAADIQTQMSFLHLTSNLETYDRFEILQTGLCQMERKVLAARLQMLAANQNPYALLDLYGPGHAVYVAGAVAYVAKCVEVEAIRLDYPNCTKEIPLGVGPNRTLRFADPFTFILRTFPTILPCDNIMPIRWRINGRWICATPRATVCTDAVTLNVTSKYFGTMDFTRGLAGGVFSEDQLEQHRLFKVAISAREAVLADVTNIAIRGASGDRLGIVVDANGMHYIRNAIGHALFPLYGLLNDSWNTLLAILMLLAFTKTAVSCSLRLYRIYELRGCGPWVFAAFYGTAFALISIPFSVLKRTMEAATTPVAHILAPDYNRPYRRVRRQLRRANGRDTDDDDDNDDDVGEDDPEGKGASAKLSPRLTTVRFTSERKDDEEPVTATRGVFTFNSAGTPATAPLD